MDKPKGLIKLKEEFHNKVLKMQAVERLVSRKSFDRLYEESTDSQKADVEKIIAEADRHRLANWIRRHPALDLCEKPVLVLRDMAAARQIKNYSRLSKVDLVRELEKYEQMGLDQ